MAWYWMVLGLHSLDDNNNSKTNNTMTVEQIKKKIKKKFGTYSNFCKIAGLDIYNFRKDFLSEKAIKDGYRGEIEFLCEKFDNKKMDELTQVHIDALILSIESVGGRYQFCVDNPQFSYQTVAGVTQGKHKRIFGEAKKLLEHFKIE